MAKARTSKALKKILKKSYHIEKNMEDLSNDPVVVAKKEKAVKLIAKYGLPESFKDKPNGKRPRRKSKA